MGKKIPILFILQMLTLALFAQVGINTVNPQGVFHIDPQSNTTPAGVNSLDDVIVTSAGRLGLGTIAPSTLLHIKTDGTSAAPVHGLRLEDGNQADGRILAAIDNSGLATWKDLTPLSAMQAETDLSKPRPLIESLNFNTDNYYYVGSYIDLPQGRWMVVVITLIAGGGNVDTPLWVSSTFADASTIANDGQVFANVVTSDIEGSGRVSGLGWTQHYATIMGAIIINNTQLTSRRYYFMMGETSTFGVSAAADVWGREIIRPGPNWGEHNIVAFRIPVN